jgi:hypothetical protein
MQRRDLVRHAGLGLGAALSVGLAGCAGALLPRAVTVSEAELAAALERAFPLDRKLLEVLDVNITQPRLQLMPERNRLGLDLALAATDRLFGRQFKGRLAFSSGLRFEPGDASLRLAQVQVTDLSLQGGGSAQAVAERLGAVLAERALEGLVVHRLSAERQAQLQRAGVKPGALRVTARGLEIPLDR